MGYWQLFPGGGMQWYRVVVAKRLRQFVEDTFDAALAIALPPGLGHEGS